MSGELMRKAVLVVWWFAGAVLATGCKSALKT
ncbi:MAG: hypothetical protein H6Q89_847, partial [Myxococcaceae bacterium]|nr:hypothetical protein [Myxococcaceae bacterium]